MCRQIGKLIVLTFLPAVIAACGGGGGGGGSPGPVSPPTPGTTVSINSGNAFDTMQVGAALLEAPVQVSLAALNPFIDMLNANVLQHTIVCSSGGTIEVSTDDVDANGAITAGDTVRISYVNNCISPDLNDRVTGSLELRIDNLFIGNDQLVVSAALSTPGGLSVAGATANGIDASFSVGAVVRSVSFEILTLDMTANDRLTISGATGVPTDREVLSQLSMTRSVRGTTTVSDGYSISASFLASSAILGGDISCRTVSDLTGDELVDLPQGGVFRCSGRSNSAAQMVSQASSGPSSPFSLQVDPEGDGTFGTAPNPSGNALVWENLIEGALVERRISRVDSFTNTLDELTVDGAALTLVDLVYAPGRNRLIGLTSTALVEIDPTTLAVSRSVDMPAAPATLGVSDDESVVWVALNDSGDLQRVSLDTMTLGPSYTMGIVQPNGSSTRQAGRVRIAPGTQDLVVIATVNGVELVAYDNGTELLGSLNANFTPNFARVDSFLFRTASSLVAADTNTTGHAVTTATLDPVSGLTIDESWYRAGGISRGRIQFSGQNVYLSGGQVVNVDNGSVEIDLRPSACCLDAMAVDSQNGEIFATDSRLGNELHVFALDGHARVGHYALPEPRPARGYNQLIATPDYLFLTGDSELLRVDRADVVPNLHSADCVRFDLSGLITSGTFASITCEMTDAVYDADRDLIYAGLNKNGTNGNSIAVIDPNLFEILDYIPLGAPAGMLRLATDNSRLFVVLDTASKVAEITLDDRQIDRMVLLGFEGTVFGPYYGSAVAASRGPDGDFVLAENRDVALFGGGTRIGTVGFNNRRYSDVFISDDGALAYGLYNGSLETFNISSSGVTYLQSLDNMVNRNASFRGNYIYSDDGRRTNMANGTTTQACETMLESVFTTRLSAPDFASDVVYYGAISDNAGPAGLHFRIVACNPETMNTGTPTATPVFAISPGQARALLPLSGNRIAVLSDAQLVFLDRPTL